VLLAIFIGAIVFNCPLCLFLSNHKRKDSAEDKLELYHEARLSYSR